MSHFGFWEGRVVDCFRSANDTEVLCMAVLQKKVGLAEARPSEFLSAADAAKRVRNCRSLF